MSTTAVAFGESEPKGVWANLIRMAEAGALLTGTELLALQIRDGSLGVVAAYREIADLELTDPAAFRSAYETSLRAYHEQHQRLAVLGVQEDMHAGKHAEELDTPVVHAQILAGYLMTAARKYGDPEPKALVLMREAEINPLDMTPVFTEDGVDIRYIRDGSGMSPALRTCFMLSMGMSRIEEMFAPELGRPELPNN